MNTAGSSLRMLPAALAVAWAGLIWYLSDQPGMDIEPLFPHQDKLFHMVIYCVLGALMMAARLPRPGEHAPRHYRQVLLAGGLYGVIDEIHQYFVPGRSTDVLDMLADLAGTAIGAILVLKLAARLVRREPGA